MRLTLLEDEVKQAVALYLNWFGVTDKIKGTDIADIKIRRKTAGKEDVGSISVLLKERSEDGERKKSGRG
jgi:hypothetical protein